MDVNVKNSLMTAVLTVVVAGSWAWDGATDDATWTTLKSDVVTK